jgi:hypothetical protein
MKPGRNDRDLPCRQDACFQLRTSEDTILDVEVRDPVLNVKLHPRKPEIVRLQFFEKGPEGRRRRGGNAFAAAKVETESIDVQAAKRSLRTRPNSGEAQTELHSRRDAVELNRGGRRVPDSYISNDDRPKQRSVDRFHFQRPSLTLRDSLGPKSQSVSDDYRGERHGQHDNQQHDGRGNEEWSFQAHWRSHAYSEKVAAKRWIERSR